VTYLGHVITKNGVAVDPAKTAAVESFPVPTNQRDVRSFLGLANYYRRFVKNFAQIAAPLNNLLKKEQDFKWTTKCQTAFDTLKLALTSAPILAYPDFQKDFILYTDAPSTAIGFILGQKDEEGRERVIAYGGRAVRQAERRWSISERETLALIEGIKNFRVYLAPKSFTVVTDHFSVQYLQQTKDVTGRLGRWAIFLQDYSFQVIYKPGRVHNNVDTLSRRVYPDEPSQEEEEEAGELPPLYLQTATVTEGEGDAAGEAHQSAGSSTVKTIAELQREDPQLKVMYDYLHDNILPTDEQIARKILMLADQHFLDEDGTLHHLQLPRGKKVTPDHVPSQLVVPYVLRDDLLRSYHWREEDIRASTAHFTISGRDTTGPVCTMTWLHTFVPVLTVSRLSVTYRRKTLP
jgi:hypothetical protein